MKWPQNELILGKDMQARHFVLEARGDVELMPHYAANGQRGIYHRRFVLSLDVADPIALYYGSAPKACIIGRDRERTKPLEIPVFFIGHVGESLDELKENAQNVAFAPSASLNFGESFTDVSFRLRRGGSHFSDIRPFFRCGLPGLLLCESSCPGDSVEIAALLVETVVTGASRQASVPQAPPKQKAAPTPPAQPVPPPAINTPPVVKPPSLAERPTASPPAPPVVLPQSEPRPPVAPSPQSAPAEPPPAPASQQVPAPPTHRLVLTFERPSGTSLTGADVLAAESRIAIEGFLFSVLGNDLVADLSQHAYETATAPDFLPTLFPHHRVTSIKPDQTQIVITAEPLYISADDLTIKIKDAVGDAVRGCEILLDVFPNHRLGAGWAAIAAAGRFRGLAFKESNGDYLLELPYSINANELLISTAENDNAARLFNVAEGCELEARPFVTVDEVKTATILRRLQATGPILISLLSTDSNFASALGSAAADGFWAAAVDLIQSASRLPWERHILARAQAPGIHRDTVILGDLKGSAPIPELPALLARLKDGSRLRPDAPTLMQAMPIERFHLDLALDLIREDAHIAPRQSFRQEALIVIPGSVKTTGSDFCRHSVRRDRAPWAAPHWLKQARKVFILEVWSKPVVDAMQRDLRAKPADDAPEGVFRCNIAEADSETIRIYALFSEMLSIDAAREAAFAYLKTAAQNHLTP